MRQKYFVELYFYTDNSLASGLQETPELNKYKNDTKMVEVISSSWDQAKKKLLLKFPDTAYMHVCETKNIEI